LFTVLGGPIISLIPSASDNSTFTGSYTITQADIDAGISEKELMRRGADVFFHVSTVKGTVRKGQRVLFERYELSGRWRASKVVVDE
jgi:cold shock CspA family protein